MTDPPVAACKAWPWGDRGVDERCGPRPAPRRRRAPSPHAPRQGEHRSSPRGRCRYWRRWPRRSAPSSPTRASPPPSNPKVSASGMIGTAGKRASGCGQHGAGGGAAAGAVGRAGCAARARPAPGERRGQRSHTHPERTKDEDGYTQANRWDRTKARGTTGRGPRPAGATGPAPSDSREHRRFTHAAEARQPRLIKAQVRGGDERVLFQQP